LSVLLEGATGTGKELFARMIHEQSGRPGRFVPVNCGALPHTMIESLLFGHRRGAFTDAHESAPGLVEAASRGTLYLDELASLPLHDQVKLLRVLESHEVYRVGETEPRGVDLRVVSSVQERPARLVTSGMLRLDFCERVAGVVVVLPPLSERGDDVWILADRFAHEHGKRLGPNVSHVLRQYGWPGNVRELRAVIERAAALADEDVIEARLIPDAIALGAAEDVAATETAPPHGTAERFEERTHLIAACTANGWHAGRTATALGIARVTLYRRLKAAGLLLRNEKRIHRVRAVSAADPV
jgi:transcriptional regulator with PAS, ATPase and Fis domain